MPVDPDGQSARRDLQQDALPVRRDFRCGARGRRPPGVRPSQNPQGGGLRFASSHACPRTSWSAVRRRPGGRISAYPGRRRSWSTTSSPTFRSRSPPSIAGRRSSSRWTTSGRSSSCSTCTSARPKQDLKNFALRDLGIMRTNKATSFRARFTDGDEARACFHYSRLLDRLEVKSIGIYQGAVADIFGGPDCPSDYAADLRSRAAWQVGQFFEKLGEKRPRQAALSRRFVAGMQRAVGPSALRHRRQG